MNDIMSVVIDLEDQTRTSKVRRVPGIVFDLSSPDPKDGKDGNLDDE